MLLFVRYRGLAAIPRGLMLLSVVKADLYFLNITQRKDESRGHLLKGCIKFQYVYLEICYEICFFCK